ADELARAGIRAEITGRPKHLYSIYSKMRAKSLDFSQIHDVSGLRVLVDEAKDCYTVLGVVHNLWAPIPREFDDYISRPKANLYRSLHTDIGHRCRGAKVNGAIVSLDYRLKNAEAVEIITAKTGGPSRDWLNPALGTIKTSRARNKVRQWFNSRDIASVVAAGRAAVE